MATKILKTVLTTIVVISYAITVQAGGPKDKPKKQENDQVLVHQCDSTCEKSFSVFPLSRKSLFVDAEKMCKKALLEYLKAEREKERNENDQKHIEESSSKEIL